MEKFKRKPLGYNFSDLNPFIDTDTMEEHYNVLYKKYEDNFNTALFENGIDTNGSYEDLLSILKASNLYNDAISTQLRNSGGGFLNHMLYFENISPFNRDYEMYASDELKYIINTVSYTMGSYSALSHTSLDEFIKVFSEVGMKVFGSGWVWLIKKDNKVMIVTTKNQDNPIMTSDCKILLGMDVWEHAYYLKHKADRASYIRDFLRTIDWSVVSNRLN
jgi:Fe-Mn family superoxide dismutase